MFASLLSMHTYADINQFVVSTVFAITKIDNRKIKPRLQNRYWIWSILNNKFVNGYMKKRLGKKAVSQNWNRILIATFFLYNIYNKPSILDEFFKKHLIACHK